MIRLAVLCSGIFLLTFSALLNNYLLLIERSLFHQ
jgi:hypothetical protein